LQFACLPVCPVVDLCYADVVLLEGGGYQQSCQFILASGGQDQTVKLWTVISASGMEFVLYVDGLDKMQTEEGVRWTDTQTHRQAHRQTIKVTIVVL
jgi:hypothetical protein